MYKYENLTILAITKTIISNAFYQSIQISFGTYFKETYQMGINLCNKQYR